MSTFFNFIIVCGSPRKKVFKFKHVLNICLTKTEIGFEIKEFAGDNKTFFYVKPTTAW